MNSPYCGRFQMTQTQHSAHDGYDLVGLDSKEIHATINGVVQYAGWENSSNHAQGFGQYVCIKGVDGKFYYYGHMSSIKVRTGQTVKCTDVIGIEGNTGYSFGSHCHYCVRRQFSRGNAFDLYSISGIPNRLGVYDDGYRPKTSPAPVKPTPKNTDTRTSTKLEPAFKMDKSVAGTYTVNASALNVRSGAGTNKLIITSIPRGTKVNCYGYYNLVGDIKWYLIQFKKGNETIAGYASSMYLTK